MKRIHLSPDRQKRLVALAEYPGAFALIPPPTPRFIPLPGIQNEVALAHEALGKLRIATESLPNPNLVTRTLDRREAVRSSQIEGTNSDINDLLTYEATGSNEGLPPDVSVTLNYVKTLEYGLNQVHLHKGNEAISINLIKSLHKHLMEDVNEYNGIAGEFRTKQNWIGAYKIYEARFVPPPANKVQECMKDLETFLKYSPNEEDFFEIPIVTRMAIAHAQFETIHPFMDGNGRVGRIILPLMLAAEGYAPIYLAGFLKSNKTTYYDTLSNVQLKGKWKDWVAFFATGVKLAAEESIKTAQTLNAIHDKWKSQIASLNIRSDSAINRLPLLMMEKPILTVQQVKDALNISFPAANNALNMLEQQGIIMQTELKSRNRTFVAKEIIDVLNIPSNQQHVKTKGIER